MAGSATPSPSGSPNLAATFLEVGVTQDPQPYLSTASAPAPEIDSLQFNPVLIEDGLVSQSGFITPHSYDFRADIYGSSNSIHDGGYLIGEEMLAQTQQQ